MEVEDELDQLLLTCENSEENLLSAKPLPTTERQESTTSISTSFPNTTTQEGRNESGIEFPVTPPNEREEDAMNNADKVDTRKDDVPSPSSPCPLPSVKQKPSFASNASKKVSDGGGKVAPKFGSTKRPTTSGPSKSKQPSGTPVLSQPLSTEDTECINRSHDCSNGTASYPELLSDSNNEEDQENGTSLSKKKPAFNDAKTSKPSFVVKLKPADKSNVQKPVAAKATKADAKSQPQARKTETSAGKAKTSLPKAKQGSTEEKAEKAEERQKAREDLLLRKAEKAKKKEERTKIMEEKVREKEEKARMKEDKAKLREEKAKAKQEKEQLRAEKQKAREEKKAHHAESGKTPGRRSPILDINSSKSGKLAETEQDSIGIAMAGPLSTPNPDAEEFDDVASLRTVIMNLQEADGFLSDTELPEMDISFEPEAEDVSYVNGAEHDTDRPMEAAKKILGKASKKQSLNTEPEVAHVDSKGDKEMKKQKKKKRKYVIASDAEDEFSNQMTGLENNGDVWVECSHCRKWRRLGGGVSADDLPEIWQCSMNTGKT